MVTIILSGVGGSSNWLPLILPLVAIVALVKGVDMLVYYIRNRKLHHADGLTNDLNAHYDDTTGQGIEHDTLL